MSQYTKTQKEFLTTLQIQKRKTKQPLVVAFVGLVASGKSTVARKLAAYISATIIEGDTIRVFLRKHGVPYDKTQRIAEHAMTKVIKSGGNVILSSDHIDPEKRSRLRQKTKELGARLVFLHTYTDYDIMAGRAVSAQYRNTQNDLFASATTTWPGNKQSRGAVVKLREMWRRTPHHYRWDKTGGGKWVLRKLDFSLFAEIDTSHPQYWKKQIKKMGKRLLAF